MLYSNIWGNALHLDLLFPGVGMRDGKLVKLMEVQQKSCATKLFSLTFSDGHAFTSKFIEEFFSLFYEDETSQIWNIFSFWYILKYQTCMGISYEKCNT